MALSSDEIRDLLAEAKTTADVDNAVWKLVKAGEVPSFITSDFWKWVTIEENGHKLEVLFAPTFFALGTSADPWFVGRASEALAQNVADQYYSLIPTWKLMQAAMKQSGLKIPYVDVKAHGVALTDIETPRACAVANQVIKDAYAARGKDFGDDLSVTWAKSYLVSPNMDGTHLCIGGGSWDATGTNTVQPPCSPHVVSYADYSQRIALVSRKAKLDGEDVDLRDDVARSSNPKIWGLVNGSGVKFDPVFPNSGGSGGKSKDSYVVTTGSGGTGATLGGRPGGVVSNDGSAAAGTVNRAISTDTQRSLVGAAVGASVAWAFVGFRVLPVAASALAGALAGRYLVDRALGAVAKLRGGGSGAAAQNGRPEAGPGGGAQSRDGLETFGGGV